MNGMKIVLPNFECIYQIILSNNRTVCESATVTCHCFGVQLETLVFRRFKCPNAHISELTEFHVKSGLIFFVLLTVYVAYYSLIIKNEF